MSKHESISCPFCDPKEVIEKNKLSYAIFDKYPVSKGHILIIPFRHVSDYFVTTGAEREAISNLLCSVKKRIDQMYNPQGFTFGINNGIAAGQSIFHIHTHLIPQYSGDVEDPTGGVRNVIPGKGNYLKSL